MTNPTSQAKQCLKCQRFFSPDSDLDNCPADGQPLKVCQTLPIIAGKYKLVEEIGSGRMGFVYLAKHAQLDTHFAIRVLSARLSQSSAATSVFKIVSKSMSTLDHPGVARVLDCGLSPAPFIVMEFVKGTVLADLLIARKKLSEKQVLILGIRLAEALSYAHAHRIVHGDLSPNSIIIDNIDGDEPTVKLLDFGIAKVLDASKTDGDQVSGFPRYMSPEQFNEHFSSSESLVGPKSDVYSMTCVLLECLTGRPLFQANSRSELRTMHQQASARAQLDDLVEKLSKCAKDIVEVLLPCLEKRASARPSAKEVAAGLKKVAAEQAGLELAIPIQKRFAQLPLKARFAIVLSALAILGLSVAGAKMLLKPQKVNKLQNISDSAKAHVSQIATPPTKHDVVKEKMTSKSKPGQAGIAIDLYKPDSAPDGIIVLLSASRIKANELAVLCSSWAERGYLVAVADVVPQQFDSAEEEAKQVSTILKDISRRKSLHLSATALPPFALSTLDLDLTQSLQTAHELTKKKPGSLAAISSLLVIDPLVDTRVALNVQDIHDCKFPAFYVLDSAVDAADRSAAQSICKKCFTLASGKQLFLSSSRAALLSAVSTDDEIILKSLLSAFFDAHLKQDKAKENSLYSNMSVLAVHSFGVFKFRQ